MILIAEIVALMGQIRIFEHFAIGEKGSELQSATKGIR